jgi:hypothetical protein
MTRNRDEFEERNVERGFAELRDGIDPPSADDLRALARTAAAAERSPRQERPRRRVTLRRAAASVALALLVGSGVGFGVANSFTATELLDAREFGAFVIAGDAVAAPAAVSTRSCAPAGPFLNVHLIGKKEGSFFAQPHVHPQVFAGIPPGTSLVSVWTFGNQASGGPVVYGWISGGRSHFSTRCRARTARAPSRGDVGPLIRVRDGWATGGRFKCSHRGRVVIQTEKLGRRMRMAVWIERTGELVALAEAGPGTAWARVSKRCSEGNL